MIQYASSMSPLLSPLDEPWSFYSAPPFSFNGMFVAFASFVPLCNVFLCIGESVSVFLFGSKDPFGRRMRLKPSQRFLWPRTPLVHITVGSRFQEPAAFPARRASLVPYRSHPSRFLCLSCLFHSAPLLSLRGSFFSRVGGPDPARFCVMWPPLLSFISRPQSCGSAFFLHVRV